MSQPTSKLSRRTLFAGAGTVGAIAAAATVLPAVRETETAEPVARPAPTQGGGYQLTERVKQYYKTTLL